MPEYSNRLLRVLTPEQRALLEPLERVTLRAGQVVYRMEQPVTHFIFPEGVLLSFVFILADGQAVDVLTSASTIIGGHTIFQVPESVHMILIRVGGGGWRVPRARLLDAMKRDPALFERLRALVHVMDRLMARNVACRSAHSVEQRFCRLLLIARDAVEGEQLPLSIPMIADMLSAHRGSLNRLARAISAEGVIAFDQHRHIELRDPAAVEARACVCYRETADDRAAALS
jgi:CRP-like cAMP-binding protein